MKCNKKTQEYRVSVGPYMTHWHNQNGELHREDGPASYNKDLTVQYWYKNGQQHRLHEPAVIREDFKAWYNNGDRHRDNGPAVIWGSGTKEWFFGDKRHREDGPAITRADGYQAYYYHGVLHRDDGPAVIDYDGKKYYYLSGKQYSRFWFFVKSFFKGNM